MTMETTPYYSKLSSKFLDDKEIACRIYEMLANDILGKEQLEKIKLRYYDMNRNFFNYSKEEAGKLIKSGTEACAWEFSKGVEPFTPKGWDRYYEDTITVPIPITHPDFKDLTTRTEKRGAIGLDLPTWFNLKDNDKRIMLVAQDPLRDNTWYSDIELNQKIPGKTGSREDYICLGALVASPFGLHGKSWRDKKNGGGRMALLVEKLIEHGYGVYLTDCRKYFVYDHKESDIYSLKKRTIYKRILEKEIGIICPGCIVAMGNQAYSYCKELLDNDPRVKYVPHFSGAATWKAKDFFEVPPKQKVSIEELAERYAEYIISEGK